RARRRGAHDEMLAATIGIHEAAAESLLEYRSIRFGRRFARRADTDEALELQRALALFLRQDLKRGRVAGEIVRLECVEPRDHLRQWAVHLEAADLDEVLQESALDRAEHRDARVVPVDRPVVRHAKLAFALALALRLRAARSPIHATRPVPRRIDEVAELARGARRVDDPVLAEKELGGIVR